MLTECVDPLRGVVSPGQHSHKDHGDPAILFRVQMRVRLGSPDSRDGARAVDLVRFEVTLRIGYVRGPAQTLRVAFGSALPRVVFTRQ
jgi:hypothetical protein